MTQKTEIFQSSREKKVIKRKNIQLLCDSEYAFLLASNALKINFFVYRRLKSSGKYNK